MPQQNWQEVRTDRDPKSLEGATAALSSVWVPMILGVIAAAAIFGLFCPTLPPQSLPLIALLTLATCMLAVAVVISRLAARVAGGAAWPVLSMFSRGHSSSRLPVR